MSALRAGLGGRFALVVLIGVAALWPLWAMVLDGMNHQGGGFLSLGDLVTWRTPVIVFGMLGAFYLGRRSARGV